MTAAVIARIDLDALRHNLGRVREEAPDSRVMAVIKANGYGHGMVQVARALADADALAVARLDEAVTLRNAGIKKPIAVLEGFASTPELSIYAEHNLQPVVHQYFHIDLLQAARLSRPLQVWLKIDTGMHRMGLVPDMAIAAATRLAGLESVGELRLMTHFACADDRRNNATSDQINCFYDSTKGLFNEVSLANSAGVMGWPLSHGDWVRPGVMLFGISPFVGGWGEDYRLEPVMSLSSRLIAVNDFKKGDAIGYGASWACPEDMPVGVVACGYGDGYPRHAESGTPVLVNGETVPLVGRVSMDSICVDLRKQPDAKLGDSVLLWGKELPVEEVARAASTIPYELLCSVTGRVVFQYLSSD